RIFRNRIEHAKLVFTLVNKSLALVKIWRINLARQMQERGTVSLGFDQCTRSIARTCSGTGNGYSQSASSHRVSISHVDCPWFATIGNWTNAPLPGNRVVDGDVMNTDDPKHTLNPRGFQRLNDDIATRV